MSEGIIISASRRSVTLLADDGELLSLTLRTKALSAVVGDRVIYSPDKESIEELLPRRNLLRRSLEGKEKILVSNVDHLFIVSSVGSLFQRDFVDRVLVESLLEGVETTLIINKVDLGLGETSQLADSYSSLGYRVLLTSAKSKDGLVELTEFLLDSKLKIVVLLGVSGVGKSTILNSLVPAAEQRIQETSEKSGQGKQTTTLAIAHRFPRKCGELLIVDLPGVQKFGLSHIEIQDIGKGFVEFKDAAEKCQYRDCLHKGEPSCEVRKRVESGLISKGRYESYMEIISEREREKKW